MPRRGKALVAILCQQALALELLAGVTDRQCRDTNFRSSRKCCYVDIFWLTLFNSKELTLRRDNPPIDSALTGDLITLDRWLFHDATLSVDIPCDYCLCVFLR
jgi:hypothetical protein